MELTLRHMEAVGVPVDLERLSFPVGRAVELVAPVPLAAREQVLAVRRITP